MISRLRGTSRFGRGNMDFDCSGFAGKDKGCKLGQRAGQHLGAKVDGSSALVCRKCSGPVEVWKPDTRIWSCKPTSSSACSGLTPSAVTRDQKSCQDQRIRNGHAVAVFARIADERLVDLKGIGADS